MMKKRWIAMAGILAVAGCGTTKAQPLSIPASATSVRSVDSILPPWVTGGKKVVDHWKTECLYRDIHEA